MTAIYPMCFPLNAVTLNANETQGLCGESTRGPSPERLKCTLGEESRCSEDHWSTQYALTLLPSHRTPVVLQAVTPQENSCYFPASGAIWVGHLAGVTNERQAEATEWRLQEHTRKGVLQLSLPFSYPPSTSPSFCLEGGRTGWSSSRHPESIEMRVTVIKTTEQQPRTLSPQ